MDRRFAADEWKKLSSSERVIRCRTMAEEAMKLARTSSAAQAEGYMKLAEQWLRLAVEIAREGKASVS